MDFWVFRLAIKVEPFAGAAAEQNGSVPARHWREQMRFSTSMARRCCAAALAYTAADRMHSVVGDQYGYRPHNEKPLHRIGDTGSVRRTR